MDGCINIVLILMFTQSPKNTLLNILNNSETNKYFEYRTPPYSNNISCFDFNKIFFSEEAKLQFISIDRDPFPGNNS